MNVFIYTYRQDDDFVIFLFGIFGTAMHLLGCFFGSGSFIVAAFSRGWCLVLAREDSLVTRVDSYIISGLIYIDLFDCTFFYFV